MKLKKKSGLMGAVIALSAASLVSVGFASWVISQGDTKAVNGSIVVDDVDNKVHQLTLTWVDEDGAEIVYGEGETPRVIFGHPATMNIADAWLTNVGGEEENLVFYLKVTCTNVDANDEISSVIEHDPVVTSTGGGTVGTGEGAKSGYAGAVADGLVQALPTATKTATNFDASGSFIYTITFEWGQTAFNKQNPYNYYNANLSATPAEKEAAALALGNLYTYLNGATFGLTVVAK